MDPSPAGSDAPYAPPSSALGRSVVEGDATPPRPGWANALGICHILAAVTAGLYALGMMAYAVVLGMMPTAGDTEVFVMGLNDPRYLGFALVDGISALVLNGFTFASGVALVNLRMWGARVWGWLAPARIGRLVVVWGWFIVGVAPGLAATVGQSMVKMMAQQAAGRGKLPTAQQISLIYSWMFLAMGIAMILGGSIYPLLAWWFARRRGIRAALVEAGAGGGGVGSKGLVVDSLGEAYPS